MKTDKIGILIFILVFVLALAIVSSVSAQKTEEDAQRQLSGGTFDVAKTVIAGGGSKAQNQSFSTETTAGQAIAGNISTGGRFSLNSGFWTPDDFLPTSATVAVGGRVLTPQGAGIRRARVSIMFPSGETRSTLSSAFGYFQFGDVEVGATYIFSVSSERFVFSPPTLVLTVNEERSDINFIADEN